MDKRTFRRMAGFSLLEVLVAVFVLAVGLMGVARLEVLSLRSNGSSALRSQATNLAYDMADRMRSNVRGVTAFDGSSVGFYNAADVGTYQAPADNGCAKTATDDAVDCTVAEMAAHDLFEWNTALAAFLPDGAGAVCVDSTPNDGTSAAPACDNVGTTHVVKVWWTDNESDGQATKRLVIEVGL